MTGLTAGFYLAGIVDLAPVAGVTGPVTAAVVGLTIPAVVRQKAAGEVQFLLALLVAGVLTLVF